jgi:hypothetical protein
MRRDVIVIEALPSCCGSVRVVLGLSETIEASTTPLRLFGLPKEVWGMTKKKRPGGGDFARGERTKATPDEGPDFARGERTKATPDEGPDFARGERTKATPDEGPDFARGERKTED